MKVQLIGLVLAISIHAQSVIINEFSQGGSGNQEWVELLVVDSGADLRGWELGDNDDGDWHAIAQFTQNETLSNMSSGSIIVVYNDGDIDSSIVSAGGPDLDISDNLLLIPISNADFLIDTGPWPGSSAFANSDRDDCPSLRNALESVIHDMAGTHPVATVVSPGSGECKYFIGNTLSEISNETYWQTGSAIEATPGSLNGGANSSWLDTSLPIELLNFEARPEKGGILLTWVTGSETENQGFILERKDQIENDFHELASFMEYPALEGQGSCTHLQNYYYFDNAVKPGRHYTYRLSDVDYTGGISRYPPIQVGYHTDGSENVARSNILNGVYPNPCNSELRLDLRIPDSDIGPLFIDIYDVCGQRVKRLWHGSGKTVPSVLTWNGQAFGDTPASSGTYILVARSQVNVESLRFLLLR